MENVTVLRAPSLTTVQDLGRADQRRQGVSVGGALDLFAARVANLLVGNAEEAALLEITFGGLRLRFNDSRSVAWCGGTFQARIAEAKFPAGCRGIVRAAKNWSSIRSKPVAARGSQSRGELMSHLFSGAGRQTCAPGLVDSKVVPCATAT